jgi:hypothetical protein
MRYYLLAIMMSMSSAWAAPEWRDESFDDDFVVSGDHLAKIVEDQSAVQLRSKNSLDLIWEYELDCVNETICEGMTRIDHVAVIANRVLAIGSGRLEIYIHFLKRTTGELVHEIHLGKVGFCGIRATIWTLATCQETDEGTGWITFNNTQSGEFKSTIPWEMFDLSGTAVAPERIWSSDFTVLRGTVVWAYYYQSNDTSGFDRIHVVRYRISDNKLIWRKEFAGLLSFLPGESFPPKVSGGLVRIYHEGIGYRYYSSLSGEEITFQ